ncbi:DUF3306 domain-containing protein [Neptuniibacter halophilus]|uniref:DUF3306 domain-containing protein n=1 Tax=Neptuniibacter halophilus TaxID=651666 RepID=UPI002572E2EA|nr:DUF3306 domain-containing protein [Neptuniibacter halophilus]
MSDKPSFFNRWSQRKAESRNDPIPDEALSAEDIPQAPEEEGVPAAETEPELTDADMPALETLDSESDFAQFFSPGVSQELRNLALRKLFLLPEFNLRDGLNDYDDDFSKMPELTQAVIDKLRSWVNEEVEEAEQQVKKELMQESDEEVAESAAATTSPEEEDDLGDADLEG